MKGIKTIINEKAHYVHYIHYINNEPHEVLTATEDSDYIYSWSFAPAKDWHGAWMYFNDGMGGSIKELDKYYTTEDREVVWVSEKVKFNQVNRIDFLKKPLKLQIEGGFTFNPFEFAHQEAFDIMYCKFCEGYFSENGCHEHMDMWEDKYRDGSDLHQ